MQIAPNFILVACSPPVPSTLPVFGDGALPSCPAFTAAPSVTSVTSSSTAPKFEERAAAPGTAMR